MPKYAQTLTVIRYTKLSSVPVKVPVNQQQSGLSESPLGLSWMSHYKSELLMKIEIFKLRKCINQENTDTLNAIMVQMWTTSVSNGTSQCEICKQNIYTWEEYRDSVILCTCVVVQMCVRRCYCLWMWIQLQGVTDMYLCWNLNVCTRNMILLLSLSLSLSLSLCVCVCVCFVCGMMHDCCISQYIHV